MVCVMLVLGYAQVCIVRSSLLSFVVEGEIKQLINISIVGGRASNREMPKSQQQNKMQLIPDINILKDNSTLTTLLDQPLRLRKYLINDTAAN